MKTRFILHLLFLSCLTGNFLSAQETEGTGIQIQNMDPSVAPGDDFFRYVNGAWMENAEIPADRTRWGSFDELRKMTDDATLEILQKTISADDLEEGSEAAKIRDFYNSILDTTARNQAGISPIQPYLDQIDQIQDLNDILDYMKEVEPITSSPFFGFSVFSSAKNSNLNILHLGTGSLGLPEREYYVGEDEDSKEKRAAYIEHVTHMLQYLGYDESTAKSKAERILALETKMAEAKLTKEDARDARKRFHFMPRTQLEEMVPSVQWVSYLDDLGYLVDSLNVSQPKYMKRIDSLFANGSIADMKDYLRWTLLNNLASYLTQEIDAANFDFYGKTLRGQEQPRPLDERALSATNRVLGEALGQLYVAEVFPPEAKDVAKNMVNNIKESFAERIENLTWMTSETKQKALNKLSTFRVKIGYPDKWKDYSDLEISSYADGGSYAENMFAYSRWNFERKRDEINKEVDKDEWFMTPQTVNAYYNPYYNEIVFPAAILQPPFFDFKADPAVNYGGIGAVIGHEISHGFDDSGSRFDAQGNLNNWWTDKDRESFDMLGKRLIAQYDSYEPLPGVNVNGTFTLGENIGDLGGLFVAYDGLQKHMKKNGRYEPIDGFSPEQRFFISWGTIWRVKQREEALKNQIKTDPHSPGVFRAIGPVVNMDAWYEAFDVQKENQSYKAPEERILIW